MGKEEGKAMESLERAGRVEEAESRLNRKTKSAEGEKKESSAEWRGEGRRRREA